MTKPNISSEIEECLTLIEDLERRIDRLRIRLKQIQRNHSDSTKN